MNRPTCATSSRHRYIYEIIVLILKNAFVLLSIYVYNYINADDATDNINRNWRYDTRLEAPKDGELRLYDVRS